MIDATGAPPLTDAVVIVNGGRIAAVGPRATTTIPRGARRLDVTGKFIVPGLWDMHSHYEQVEWGPNYLAAGDTTARDVGNELDFVIAVRQPLFREKALGRALLAASSMDPTDVARRALKARGGSASITTPVLIRSRSIRASRRRCWRKSRGPRTGWA